VAQLMQAAPDLLEALQHVLSELENDTPDDISYQRVKLAIQRATASPMGKE
jgi:hypothetical protein